MAFEKGAYPENSHMFCIVLLIIIIIITIIIIIVVISIAPYLIDKGEHTTLYKTTKTYTLKPQKYHLHNYNFVFLAHQDDSKAVGTKR